MEGQVYKTFTYGSTIVRVYRPDLTDEERKRRQKEIYKAAAELLKEVQKGAVKHV